MQQGQTNFTGWFSAKALKYPPYFCSGGKGFAMQSIAPMRSFIVDTKGTGVNFPGWYLPDAVDANVGLELIVKGYANGWTRLDSDSSSTSNILIGRNSGITDHVKFLSGGSVTLRLIKDGSGNFWWLLLKSYQPPGWNS